MLKIRLQRIGKRGQAYFKVVVTEHTVKPQGKYLELLGSYDPHKNEISVDAKKVKYWLGQGAKMSETVNNLLVNRGVIEGKKVKVWKPKTRAVETQKKTENRNLDQGITTEGNIGRPSADTEIKKDQEAQKKSEEGTKEEQTPESSKEGKKEEPALVAAEIPVAN